MGVERGGGIIKPCTPNIHTCPTLKYNSQKFDRMVGPIGNNFQNTVVNDMLNWE